MNAEASHTNKKKFLIMLAVGYFSLTLLLDWIGVTNGGRPTTPAGFLWVIGLAAGETLVFIALFYIAGRYVLRFIHRKKNSDGH